MHSARGELVRQHDPLAVDALARREDPSLRQTIACSAREGRDPKLA